jgi:DNA-binding CsgD family transcriptional regulator
MHAWVAARYDDAHAILHRLEAEAGADADFVEGFRHLAIAVVPGFLQDQNERARRLAAADAAFERTGFAFGRTIIHMVDLVAVVHKFDIPTRLQRTEEVLRMVAHHKLDHSVDALIMRAMYAEALYLADLLPEAATNFKKCLSSTIPFAESAQAKSLAATALQLIDIAVLGPDAVVIDPQQDESAWRSAVAALSPPPIGRIAAMRILRDFLRHDRAGAARTLQAAGIDSENLQKLHPNLQIAALADAILFGEADDSHMELLRSLISRLDQLGNHALSAQCRALLITATAMCGRTEEATKALIDFLPPVERAHGHRIILDLPPLHGLLEQIDGSYARRLRLHARRHHFHRITLSTRQVDLLRELASERSTEQIAAALGIKLSSLYVRCSELYRHLHVRNRTEAIQVFDMMHWLR